MPDKLTIGRAEIVTLPELGVASLHARVDTGARTSAIWVASAVVENGSLVVIFFGPGHPAYTGKKYHFNSYTQELVTSSTGHEQLRYKIRLLVVLEGRRIRAGFTLADRSTQIYPMLIGRNVLRGKFIVDVKTGNTLLAAEKELMKKKQDALSERNDQ